MSKELSKHVAYAVRRSLGYGLPEVFAPRRAETFLCDKNSRKKDDEGYDPQAPKSGRWLATEEGTKQ